jgi:hypothetical protein
MEPHTVALQTADAAGWTANVSQSVKVDTQAPQLSTSLDGETSGVNLYKGKVTLSASATDDPAGSGLNRIEYQDNNGLWTIYTDPIPFYNNEHEVNVRAVDGAGLISPVQTYNFSVESSGPVIAVQAQWQISDTVPLEVSSSMFQLQSLSVTFSDPQNRWPEVSQSYTVSGNHFSGGIHWDGSFNSIWAPSGTYTATIHATDDVGNISEVSAQITIPQPAPTSTTTPTKTAVIATKTPTSQITASTTPTSTTVIETTTATPQATLAAPGAVTTPNNIAQTFSSPPNTPQPSPILPSNVLWGSAAAAVIAAATAAALEAARKRKEEEAAQKAAAEAAADQFNAAQSIIDAQIKAERAERWRLQQEEAANADLQPFRQEGEASMNSKYEYNHKKFREADAASMDSYEEYMLKETGDVSQKTGVFGGIQSWINNRITQTWDNLTSITYHPPKAISVSFDPAAEMTFKSITTSILDNPRGNSFLENIGYQKARIAIKKSLSTTINPDAPIDINMNDFKISFTVNNTKIFFQPLASSFGWSQSSNIVKNPDIPNLYSKTTNSTTFDYDFLGPNAFSWKISNTSSLDTSVLAEKNGQKTETTDSTSVEGTMNIHRWIRPLAGALVGGAVIAIAGPAIAAAVTGGVIATGLETAVAFLSTWIPKLMTQP